MVSHKMNTFFHAIGTASFSLAVASATLAAPVWETDFNKGLETARAENRPVMVEFTGSDWWNWTFRVRREKSPRNS